MPDFFHRSILIIILSATLPAPVKACTLSLREALGRTVANSPELAGFSYEERAADARILQAGIQPNPEASLRVENFAPTNSHLSEANESTLELSQLLELGGKRTMRLRDAQAGK